MIHQGALVESNHSKKIIQERLLTGNFNEVIHIHLKKESEMEDQVSVTPSAFFVISGEIEFVSNGKNYLMRRGDYITFEAHVPHSIISYADTHLLMLK